MTNSAVSDIPGMLTWTVPQRETAETPIFSIAGVFVSWPDGKPAVLKQTPFKWDGDAWQAAVEVSSAGSEPRFAYGTIRLRPAVISAWELRRLNPRRQAADQLRSIMPAHPERSNLGTVTFWP
jgi:hypothetical protein